MARALAESKNVEGWIFTLDFPSYLPFVTYADNRELRKEITIAAGKKAFQNNEFDNQEITLQIAKLRYERANLLGYETHAHFVLEERMAQHPETVKTFLNDLLAKAKPAAQREFAQLSAFAKEKDGLDHLEKWDGAYYSEKLKQELFDLDDELLKPYFQLVLDYLCAFVGAANNYARLRCFLSIFARSLWLGITLRFCDVWG